MSVLSIIRIHKDNYDLKDFCLNRECEPVREEEFDSPTLKSLILNMFETLYDYSSGVGLAANQVGVLKKICVIDIKRDGKKPLVCINPEYTPISESQVESKEQCISFPNVVVAVKRYSKIKVNYQDIHGHSQEIIAEGFKAMVLQHEIDHLNGVVFLDRVDMTKDVQPERTYSRGLSERAMGVLDSE